MFCQKCGAALPDDSRFCTECGTVLASGTPRPAPTYAPVAPAYIPPAPVQPQVFSDHPVVAAIKKLGRSPLFLIATIFYTLVQLFNLVQYVGNVSGNNVYAFMQALEGLQLPYDVMRGIADALSSVSGPSNFVSLLFGILVMSGLWAVYGASVSKRPRAGTAGLTMIFVTLLLDLILVCLCLLIVLIVLLIALSAISVGAGAEAEAALIAVLVVIGVIAGIMAYMLVYDIKIFNSISRIKASLRTGTPDHKISGFVAVMCFIGSGFGLIGSAMSLVGSLPYLRWMTVFNWIALVIGIMGNVIPLLFGILIFMYKSKMKKFLAPIAPKPSYVAPVSAPVAPVAPVVETPAPVAPVEEIPVVEIPVETAPAEEAPVAEEAAAEPVSVEAE